MSNDLSLSSSSSSGGSGGGGSEQDGGAVTAAARLADVLVQARELSLSFGATEIVAVSSESDEDGLDGGSGVHRLWADMIEEEEEEQRRIATEERLEHGKKLFLGGLCNINPSFRIVDIETVAATTTAAVASEIDYEGTRKRLAVALFVVWKMLCAAAGSEPVRLKVCLDREFVFSIFASRNRAFAAIRALKTFEARKALIAEQASFLTNELHLEPALLALCLPKPSMYCRWPRNYLETLIKAQATKNKKKASPKKRATTKAGTASTSTAATTTSNKVIAKRPKKQPARDQS